MSVDRIRIQAPAKINLGLEILGRRDDGLHEIRSILAMLELADDLVLTRCAHGQQTRITGVPGVTTEENLITRAVNAFAAATRGPQAWQIEVTKRIPTPAGLGGASSNAAATLLALNAATDQPLDEIALCRLGATLGSDVPFFLGEPCALVAGTGTELTPLLAPTGWLVLAVPPIDIDAKTARLYRALSDRDFSDGARMAAQAARLSVGQVPDASLFGNAFSRPLSNLIGGIDDVRDAMRASGCGHAALSGAGPAHYALCPTEAIARKAADHLAAAIGDQFTVQVTSFRQARLTPEICTVKA